MRRFIYCPVQWLVLFGFLTGICGCASLMDVVPTPPGFLARVDLSGPFDDDIPLVKVNHIKSASLLMDEAVPYLFMSVAAGFDAQGDQEKTLHFFNRATAEFRKRNNVYGEAAVWSRKIASLLRFGKTSDAIQLIQEMETRWSGTRLQAFVLFNFGHYHRTNGDTAKALDYLVRALSVNTDYEGNPDLTALRRDTELECGIALVYGDYFPAVSAHLYPAFFNEAFYQDIRKNVVTGLSHLSRASALNDELRVTALIRYYPEMIPSYQESDLHRYMGLAHAILGQSTRAVSHLEEANSLARRAGYMLGEADHTFFLNQVYLLDKNTTAGLKAAADLEDIANRYQLTSYVIWAQIISAHHAREAGDTVRSRDAVNRALTAIQQHESWLSSFPGFRGVGSFRQQVLLEALFDLQIQKGDDREAFRTAERIKALASVSFCGADMDGKTTAAADAIQNLDLYRQTMVQSYQKLLSPVNAPSVFKETVEILRQTQNAFGNACVKRNKLNEAIFPWTSSDPPELNAIQQVLDQHTTLFAYYGGEQSLYVWVISQKGFHQVILKISRAGVEELVQAYHQAVRSRDKGQMDAMSEKVYDTLLKPVIPFVRGDRIGILSHGPLGRLPFASMRYVKAYLVDGFSIFYLKHASMLTQAIGPVLIDLWPVDEKPKALLMEYLYKNLEKNKNYADALRAAQNEMIQAGFSPKDWAATIVVNRP
jgi:tetratricopeptide (TPR) repeat protein